MKKFLSIISALMFTSLLLLIVVLLNLKIAFSNQESLKDVAQESNLSQVVAMYIKDDIVNKANIDLDQGSIFEDLEKEVSIQKVDRLIDETIEYFFLALKEPTDQNLTFDVTFPLKVYNQDISFERTVYLKDNVAFMTIAGAGAITIYLLIVATLFFVLALLLYSEKKVERLNLLSSIFFVSLLLVLITYLGLRYLIPENVSSIIEISGFVQEQKLINGIKNILTAVFSRQTILYVVEIIILSVMAIFFRFWAKTIDRQKLDKIEGKL